jgi:hypothetical protein
MVADVLDRWLAPDWIFTHIASGELRDKATAGRLKRMGVKPGWPDFILISPEGRSHFLELKRRGGRLTPEQAAFADWCEATPREVTVAFACCDSFDGALETLKGWGALRVSVNA